VEGPFNDRGEKVNILGKSKSYHFKVTAFNRNPKIQELKNLQWALQYDYGALAIIPNVRGSRTIKITLNTVSGLFTKMTVYAYIKRPNKTASATASLIFNLPIFIDRFRIKGLDRQGKNVADDMCYGTGISKRYPSKYLLSEIYAIPKGKGIAMYAQNKLSTNKILWLDFKVMATKLAIGDLDSVIRKMIQKFERNEGGEFTDPMLTKHVKNHASTKNFCTSIENEIRRRLKIKKGSLDIADNQIYYSDKAKGFYGPRTWGHPKFSTMNDTFWGGLRICINDVWAYEVLLTEFIKKGRDYEIKYKVILYDHFGLDMPDIDKFFGMGAGFRAWFLLQHVRNFKPFITKVEFEKTFLVSL